MSAQIYYLRDYHVKKLEREVAELMGQVLEIAQEGGPIVTGATPDPDPWAGKHCPGGIDDLNLA